MRILCLRKKQLDPAVIQHFKATLLYPATASKNCIKAFIIVAFRNIGCYLYTQSQIWARNILTPETVTFLDEF
jgi:hypothetical protein